MQLVGVCLSVALALGQVLSALPALAQARTDVWERIEARRLDARAEVVSLPVGRREGRYTAVRLSVPADPVFVREMSVVLASGEVRVVGLRRWLGGGEQTEALSVAGGIAEIRLIVRGEAASPANPIVELLGEVASTHLARPRRPHWRKVSRRAGYRSASSGWRPRTAMSRSGLAARRATSTGSPFARVTGGSC
jgi:hypothetical protein